MYYVVNLTKNEFYAMHRDLRKCETLLKCSQSMFPEDRIGMMGEADFLKWKEDTGYKFGFEK